MMEIGWSASEIIKRQQKEARRRKKQLLQQYEGMTLQEAKAADDKKRLAEYHAFCEYKEEMLRRARERRTEDVGSG